MRNGPATSSSTAASPSRPSSRLGPGNYRRLARALQVTPTHISRVLRGKHGASDELLERLARETDLDLPTVKRYIARQRSA